MSGLPPQKFLPLTPAPRSNFLSLAPATSPSYPKKPVTSARTHTRPAAPRRSSSGSTSSSSSSSNSYRILKLGPVHYGEHLADDHQADFHDVILH
ncbi:hypothetical protein BHE90_014917 [Fusarium euwallaceae]|uniref:Uncharacterized protein n=2 Tax=Fusarium solani species complex TaxID=232080 RepID=A0A3M2RML3_9HYPO|nr:hypothetical protein CDV36_013873 [Fusarium kuroshium]RTE70680.1 hypothetical protein BHE90_014917 [Fusarium euwallaceae]